MRAKRTGWQRIRFDSAYIFASGLAVFGGIAVLGSYAAQKPPATDKPGTYKLSRYATKKPGEYKIGIKQGLTYCVEPVDPASVPCFVAQSTNDNYLLKLTGSPTSLIVKAE